jgi:hypothetical protein
MNVLRGVVLSAGLALGLVVLAPSTYAQTYWNGAPSAPPPAPAYAAPGPYGWGPGYGGWAPGYGVNDIAVAPHPYWNGAPQAIGPGW